MLINTSVIETSGDKEQNMPLHLVEGKDFFTSEIQEYVKNGKADFAIHSMKDVSSVDFFKESRYAIIDRDLLYDVAIFNEEVLQKIKNGEKIIIGTSSPRRSNMATSFLQKALPILNEQVAVVEAQSIRGNVDSRLQKLHNGNFDGIIIAVAGINRLLQYGPSLEKVNALLKNKKVMVLPLFECPPAAGQGAIVAETTTDNKEAIEILNTLNNAALTKAINQERIYARQYGYGCSQQFGVFHVDNTNTPFTYASGKNTDATTFTEWFFNTSLKLTGKQLFSAADYMKDFFTYNFLEDEIDEKAKTIFISSHKAVHSEKIKNAIQQKRVWVAGTKTWYSLAKKGIWVEGCADGLGFNFLQPVFKSPFINIALSDMLIITNTSSKKHWIKDGVTAIGTYDLVEKLPMELKNKLAEADVIFWTSFQQYEMCRQFIKQTVQHVCPSGKTAKLLKDEGLEPFIFPTIKSFNYWRVKNENMG